MKYNKLVESIGELLEKGRRKAYYASNSVYLLDTKSQTLSDHLNRKVYIYDLISHILGEQNASGFN